MAEIFQPYKGFQENFVRTNVDVCVGGGAVAVGKSTAAWMNVAEDFLDPNFRAVFLRNNIDDLKAGGGLLDIAQEVFGESVKIIKSDNPRVEYIPTGAVVEVTHVADQSRDKVEQRFKGRQLDKVYFDEASGFTWETFVTIATRNRGRTGKSPQILMTTNPKRKHWLRKMVDWYIKEDGTVDEEREGVVRYFFVNGTTVDDLIWGSSKEEVYSQCKTIIDRFVRGAYGRNITPPPDAWKSLIKSFTYYQGRMAENTANMQRNANYLGSVAMAGGANALNYIEGNWNADPDDDKDNLLTNQELEMVFLNDEQRNGDRWVTCDLADTGTDNVVMLAWDGLHVIDMEILSQSLPKENAEHLKAFARRNNVGDKHIIYDAIRARYINDYIFEAVPFESYRAPMGVNALQYVKLKDCCYGKLISLIKRNGISFSQDISKRAYTHQNLRQRISVEEEFKEEAKVIRYVDAPSGKTRLMTKKEMNQKLGRGRSMDVLDVCAMRMYPLLNIPDGYELENSRRQYEGYQDEMDSGNRVNIYDDTNFGISYG